MKEKRKRKKSPLTGRVAVAGAELPSARKGTQTKKNFSPEILAAQEFLRSIDDSRLREWLRKSHAKRPPDWNKVAAFKAILTDPSWLHTDVSGKVTNVHNQAFNEYERRSEEAFRSALQVLKSQWNTVEARIKEAEHLVALAAASSTGSMTLTTYMAMVQWEFARYLFASGELHEYQMIKASAGKLIQNYGYQALFDHPLFPVSSWSELPEADQNFLMRMLAGDVDRAVRILSLEEWWPTLGYVSAKLYNTILEQHHNTGLHENETPLTICEHPLETELCEVSYLVVRLDWRKRENTLKKELVEELKRIRPGWSPSERRGRGPKQESQSLRGLACQWLIDTKLSKSEIANLVYPRQARPSKKGAPTDDAEKARQRALLKIQDLKKNYLERVPTAYIDLRNWEDSFADRLGSLFSPV